MERYWVEVGKGDGRERVGGRRREEHGEGGRRRERKGELKLHSICISLFGLGKSIFLN